MSWASFRSGWPTRSSGCVWHTADQGTKQQTEQQIRQGAKGREWKVEQQIRQGIGTGVVLEEGVSLTL